MDIGIELYRRLDRGDRQEPPVPPELRQQDRRIKSYIDLLAKKIAQKTLPADRLNEQQIQNLPTRMLQRQMAIQLMLNSSSNDLALRRQIIPATRGATKQVTFGR